MENNPQKEKKKRKYERADGRLQKAIELPATYIDGKRKRNRKWIYADKNSELSEKLQDAQGKMGMGYYFKGDRLTIAKYLPYWLETYCSTKSPTTLVGYKNYINKHIIPDLGSIKLSKLLPAQIQAFYNSEFKKGYSGKTVLQVHSILHKAFNDAVKNGLMPYNILTKVDRPKHEPHVPDHVPTPDEIAYLLYKAEGTIHLMPILLGSLGLRRSEVFARKWNSFAIQKVRDKDGNFQDKGILKIHDVVVIAEKKLHYKEPKNATSKRSIPIPDKLLPYFKKQRGLPEAFMCLNEKGKPISVKSYNGRFTNFLKSIELPHFRFHDLRHYMATLLLALDIDPKKAAAFIGHSSPSTLQKVYQHTDWTMNLDIAKRIDQTL